MNFKKHWILYAILGIVTISVIYIINRNSNPATKKEIVKPNSLSVHSVTVLLQPFNDIPNKRTNYLFEKLKLVYPNCKLLPTTSIPITAYYPPRNRYRADSLLKWLTIRPNKNEIIVGITAKDISTTKGTNPDSGIFGLGYMPGNACVISSHRLRTNINEQLYKVLIHELGHNMSLDHCPLNTCYMRDAKGKNHLDEQTNFCPTCKKVLLKKGWSL